MSLLLRLSYHRHIAYSFHLQHGRVRDI